MKVIVTNGPPFSGKDTLTKEYIKRNPDAIWRRMKDTLYIESYRRLFGKHAEFTLENWIELCNDVDKKDQPGLDLKGVLLERSPRQELIYESEECIKKKYGPGGVAVCASKLIKEEKDFKKKTFIFSDGGFNIEIPTLIEELGIKREDILLIRIEAEGCNFDNDSREYIDNPDVTVFNDKTDNFFKVCEDAGIFKW